MSSKVSICNTALQRIGAGRITSLDDGTEEANACSTIYDMIVDEVTAARPWSTAVIRTDLAQTTNTPSFGFAYEYQLPVDPKCLSVIEIDSNTANEIEYRIEGDKLITDEPTMSIRYIGRLTSSDSYGPYLTKVIVSRLALELSYKFAGNATLVQTMEGKYERDLEEQGALDSLQGTSDTINTDSYIRIRN